MLSSSTLQIGATLSAGVQNSKAMIKFYSAGNGSCRWTLPTDKETAGTFLLKQDQTVKVADIRDIRWKF